MCQMLLGSIPASAGQPNLLYHVASLCEVYPRECGAAICGHLLDLMFLGLSPRVRGSRSESRRDRPRGRSIPASAGQPPENPHLSGAF